MKFETLLLFMSIKKIFAFSIILFSFSITVAQSDFRNGFIITNDNDTIQGEIDYRFNLKNYESCVFKDGQTEIKYYPDQIKGFGYVNDKYFSSQILKGSFVESLVIGNLSLYKSKDKYHLKKESQIIDLELKKEKTQIDGRTVIKESSHWRGLINYFISDCIFKFDVSNLRFTEKSLTELIIKYNRCKGSDFAELKESKLWTKFDIGAVIGLSRSTIQTKDEFDEFGYIDDNYNSIDPSIGILFAISSPRIAEEIELQGEIHYIKSSYSSLVVRSNMGYFDTFIDLRTLSIPVSLKYSFPERKIGYYMQGGLNYDNHLQAETRLLEERINGNVVNTLPESSAFNISSNVIGIWGGIGIQKSFEKFQGSIAIRYFQMPGLSKTFGLKTDNNRITINLIISSK